MEPGRPHMTTWSTRIACGIPKAINTHSDYIILIDFPLQKWLRERASMLLYTHIASRMNYKYTTPLTFQFERRYVFKKLSR